MFKRVEVLTLMAHLLITLALIGGYLYTLIALNAPDETLKLAIMTILGYWFGAVNRIEKKAKGEIDNAGNNKRNV